MGWSKFAHNHGVEVVDHQAHFAGSATSVATFQLAGRERHRLRPCVLYIHGGGFTYGDRYSNTEELIAAVASEGILGVTVDYRLAPDHPFPEGLNDCETALGWIIENASSLNVDPSRIVLMGVSAGGALAVSLALRVSERFQGNITGLLLSCPMLDDRTVRGADPVGTVRTWTFEDNSAGWEQYLGSTHPTGDSVPARAADLSGLPPTFVDVGTDDIFYEEGLAFAANLRRSGVMVELHTWNLGYHGFDIFEPSSQMAVQAVQVRLTWLRSRISG